MNFKRKRLLLTSISLLILCLSYLAASPTPARATFNVDFRQCENGSAVPHDCSWINGILNPVHSEYVEGMSTPQRLIFVDIDNSNGNSHTLTFSVLATKGGIHAYDWLTSWQQAIDAAKAENVPYHDLFGQTCDPAIDGVGADCAALKAGKTKFVDVPDDPFVSHDGGTQSHIDAYEAKYGNRQIEIFSDADITAGNLSLSHSVADNGDTSDSFINYTLTWTSASTRIMIEMAGHLALSPSFGGIGWGAGKGASFVNGGPYHFKLGDLDPNTSVSVSLGSQDNQIQAGTILPPGLLIVKKVTVPSPDPTNTSFGFTPDYEVPFSLTNGGENDSAPLAPGTYSVSENSPLPTGWTLTSATCDNGSPVSAVVLVGGDIVTCTFTNTFLAHPTLPTTPNPTTANVGDKLNDSATLTGGYSPFDTTKQITFSLFGPGDPTCAGTAAFTQSVNVSAAGSASTNNTTFATNLAGTWHWTASYPGDANNNPASSVCADEPVIVKSPNLSITKTADAATVFAGDTIGFTITVSNAGQGTAYGVTVSDTLPTNAGLAWTIDASKTMGTWTITSGVLSYGPADLAAGDSVHVHITSPTTKATVTACPTAATVNNTAHVSATNNPSVPDATASITVNCLAVTKTASTTFKRTYHWNITKSADQTNVKLQAGSDSIVVNYTVTVSATYTDSDFAVSGNIKVHNPATIPATISKPSDVISLSGAPDIAGTVDCGLTVFPYSLAAGGDLICAYSASLPDNSSRTNTATATLTNGTSFTGTAAVTFGTTTSNEVDKCINVVDAFNGGTPDNLTPSGPLCFGGSGTTFTVTFKYTRLIGPYATCGQYTVPNTATFTTTDVPNVTGSASWTVNVNVPCVGCTLTIGFWKTHAGGVGHNPDVVTKKLPIYLGADISVLAGPKTQTVTTAQQAINFLSFMGSNNTADSSNGINKLYAQLLGAKLNIAYGADASAATSTIIAADTFLATHDSTSWKGLSKTQQQTVVTLMTTLTNYNTGLIGPGHCTETTQIFNGFTVTVTTNSTTTTTTTNTTQSTATPAPNPTFSPSKK